MPATKRSECINHPGVEATVRCKQCGKPACDACAVSGATGRFCSQDCKEKHEAFIRRAQQLETQKRRGSLSGGIRKLLSWIFIVAAVVFLLVVVGSIFTGIPILSDFAVWVRSLI